MRQIHIRSVLIVAAIGVLLSAWVASLSLVAAAQPPPPPLPPIPPTPAPKPTSPPATGGLIELHTQFPGTWPWSEIHWQELWTVVQWQDAKGVWRNVEGWQGTLDGVRTDEDGRVVGYKTWWAANKDLGRGPFRWVVYKSRGNYRPMVISESFNLPDAANKTVKVEVSLGP